MSAKKTIKYEDLVDILSHYSTALLSDEGRNSFLQKNEQFCSRTEKGPVFDYNAYIRRLKSKIAEHDLVEYITIEKGRSTLISETGYLRHTKYWLTVKNLIIEFDRNSISNTLHFDPLAIEEHYPSDSRLSTDKYSGGLHVTFINNEFTSTTKGYNGWVWSSLSDHAYVSFVGNTFNDVDVRIRGSTKEGCFLELKDNIFDNRLVTIYASSTPPITNERNQAHHGLKDNVYNQKQVNQLEQHEIKEESFKYLESLNKRAKDVGDVSLNDIAIMLFNMHNWARAKSDDMTAREPAREECACVVLDNNTFNCLGINVNGCCWLTGKNKVELLGVCAISPYWHFGPYQEIDQRGNHAEVHRDIFLNLYNKAIEKNDQSQARILQLEIKKCEHHILRRERISLANIQDRVIYSWGYWVSRETVKNSV